VYYEPVPNRNKTHCCAQLANRRNINRMLLVLCEICNDFVNSFDLCVDIGLVKVRQ
jgi:hypothetical protein